MRFDNPLSAVYEAYLVSLNSLNDALLRAREQHVLESRRTAFDVASRVDAENALELAERQASDLAVFALFAAFERYVIEHLQTAHERLAKGYPIEYSRKLAEKFKTEVEYWRFDEILDLFKPELDANQIGRVKQIKRYRDWIAHRNTSKRAPPRSTPNDAFHVLSNVANEVCRIHTATSRDSVAYARPHSKPAVSLASHAEQPSSDSYTNAAGDAMRAPEAVP